MYIKILFDNARFAGVLKLILVLATIDFIGIYYKVPLPFGLLYGPLLLLIVKKMVPVRFWIHTIPFFLFCCLQLLLTNTHSIASGNGKYYYGLLYLGAVAVSLLGCAIAVSAGNKTTAKPAVEQNFIQLLLYGCYTASLLLGGQLLVTGFEIQNLGFDPITVLFFQSGVFLLLILMYLVFFEAEKNKKRKQRFSGDEAIGLDENTSATYIKTLEKCIRETDIYRNPDISLEMLSSETTIPKHHLTQLLNGYMGKNFYQYIAGLRIEYALSCLKEDSGIKIESLAYDCGFNSKTSFNRYFKEYTGYLPSCYKAKVQHL